MAPHSVAALQPALEQRMWMAANAAAMRGAGLAPPGPALPSPHRRNSRPPSPPPSQNDGPQPLQSPLQLLAAVLKDIASRVLLNVRSPPPTHPAKPFPHFACAHPWARPLPGMRTWCCNNWTCLHQSKFSA